MSAARILTTYNIEHRQKSVAIGPHLNQKMTQQLLPITLFCDRVCVIWKGGKSGKTMVSQTYRTMPIQDIERHRYETFACKPYRIVEQFNHRIRQFERQAAFSLYVMLKV